MLACIIYLCYVTLQHFIADCIKIGKGTREIWMMVRGENSISRRLQTGGEKGGPMMVKEKVYSKVKVLWTVTKVNILCVSPDKLLNLWLCYDF
jgi:hypothetical protein